MRRARLAALLAAAVAASGGVAAAVPPPPPAARAAPAGPAPSAPTPLKLRDGKRPVRDSGIGAVLKVEGEKVLIGQILLGLGAQAAGLGKDDQILAVDGNTTKDRQLQEVLLWIRGEKGVPVELTVHRVGAAQPEKIVIVRRPLKDAKQPAPDDYLPATAGKVTLFRCGETIIGVLAEPLGADLSTTVEISHAQWTPGKKMKFARERVSLGKPLTIEPLTLHLLVAGDPSALYFKPREAVPTATATATDVVDLARVNPRSPKLKWTTPPPPPAPPPAAAAPPVPQARPRLDLVGKASPVLTIDRWVNQPPTLGKDMGGRVLLIDFWATWCGPCKQTMPALADLARDLGGKGLTIVGISIDEEVEAVETFLKTNPLPYPVGWTLGEELDRFGGSGIPALVLVGPDGVVRMFHTGAPIPAEEIRKKVAELVKPTTAR